MLPDRRATIDSFEFDYDGEVPRFWFSSRFAMALLGFIGFLSMSSQRMCINVALVCMLNQTAMQSASPSSSHYQPPAPSSDVIVTSVRNLSTGGNVTTDVIGDSVSLGSKACGGIPEIFVLNTSEFHHLYNGEFVWPETTQLAITDAFYWGYVITQVPSGWLAHRFGGKRVFGFMLLASSLSTALIPIAARTHLFLLLTLRFIGGLGAGATFPAMHTLWGKWAPPQERSLLASITYAGSLTGSVIIFPIAGLLCEYGIDGKGFDGGWPAIFYIFGALGVVWFILWMIFASESPAEHGRINVIERQYIVDTLMSQSVTSQKVLKIPWSKVLTSFPFIAIVLCNFTYEWGVYTFERLFRTFQQEVLLLDIKLNTVWALLPYLGLWVIVMASGGGADRLQSHGVLSTTATRKVMQLIGAIVPACMVAANGFIDCSQWRGAISFMTIGLSFCGFQYNGFLVNHLDIAPRFAGILMGIANAIGSTASFWLSYFLGIIMSTSQDVFEQWQTVFLITSAFYVFSTLFYLFCGSGNIQSWAMDSPIETGQTQVMPNSLPDTRPHSTVLRQLSSPSNLQSIYGVRPASDTSDTLRRTIELSPLPDVKVTTNHLTASSGVAADDSDTLNRKSSNKSTSSKTRDEVSVRRTDHDRDHHRTRHDVAGSTKRHSKPMPKSSRPEDSLEIYESLSESPV